jgi:CDP-glucose 4,6-dehydratase
VGRWDRALEGMVKDRVTWHGRSVLVTGHTGFKGGWLSLWLKTLGADVHGYALDPPTDPSFFEVARVGGLLASDTRGDLAHLDGLTAAVASARPEVVFHLAAQPLVRESYRDPLGTLRSNVLGTAHVLEAARQVPGLRAVVVVTTDKVYHNREWPYPYREVDALGGHDIYSGSKAAAEIVTASYRASFFGGGEAQPARISTARAGNVIGGGDWAADRLVPDCLRAFEGGRPVRLRYPDAVRPWQHVLEPLSGYLRLAERLLGPDADGAVGAWNFAPGASGDASVAAVAEAAARLWGGGARVERQSEGAHPHEAGVLRLDATRARTQLGWRPRWSLERALVETVAWQQAWRSGADMREISARQIAEYGSPGAP